ncbi:MAG: SEC-C metal-binding domain-containing protein [Defluviitaleaceae bacterium]|nr:SEC-C metal-binding domain-containing protein [Defluviitaleaceae bacterium]
MALYDAWKRIAFDTQGQPVKHVWDDYLSQEKKVYKEILSQKLQLIEGTLAELGQNFNLSNIHMAAFVDGIHEAVDNLPPVDELAEDTAIKLDIDFKRLYKQMVEYKANELYTLSEWDDIFTPEEQQIFYKEQKKSHTIIRSEKIGRNDPCTCGSGKKYKKCCGNA